MKLGIIKGVDVGQNAHRLTYGVSRHETRLPSRAPQSWVFNALNFDDHGA